MNAPSVFSRLLLIFGSIAVVGLTYWFISTSLAPVAVPEVPASRTKVKFDPTADVTKKPYFSDMHPLGPDLALPSSIGRQNPFVPVIPVSSTSTATTTQHVPVAMPTPNPTPAVPAATSSVLEGVTTSTP